MMRFEPATALTLRRPGSAMLPLVCDSPHSGAVYPEDFGSCCTPAQLRRAEDSHVDQLWGNAPAHGATLIAARFPRSYIDANRALDDLDAALLDAPWPAPLRPSERSRRGFGLIWRQLAPEQPLYRRKLGVAEVQARIANCWRPYTEALDAALQEAQRRAGAVWHLNLHSMPQPEQGRPADFVLGDLDGRSCEPKLTAVVEASLRAHGYSVARNKPYKGAALVARHGDPARGRHSLQIEVRRPLYMDEATRAPHAGFAALQQCLDATLAAVAAHVRQSIPARCG